MNRNQVGFGFGIELKASKLNTQKLYDVVSKNVEKAFIRGSNNGSKEIYGINPSPDILENIAKKFDGFTESIMTVISHKGEIIVPFFGH